MSSFKRSQAKYVKQTHKIANWPAYDQALVARGSLTFWFTDEAISKWTAPPSGKAGGQRKYSNLAIETALAFRMVFHLPWRQTKGCLQSLVEIHGLTLEIPHQTTFSRRAKGLGKVAFHRPRHDRPIHILVDFHPRKHPTVALGALPSRLLQWGRGLPSAETRHRRRGIARPGLLQWGRGLPSAETRKWRTYFRQVRRASMGPRTSIRGNRLHASARYRNGRSFNGAADFHPRKRVEDRAHGRIIQASMGPRTSIRGNRMGPPAGV